MVAHARENLRYLPGFVIPDGVTSTLVSELENGFDAWIIAVPSGAVGEVLPHITDPEPVVVLASKGLEPGTGRPLSAVVEEHLAGRGSVAALSGPNLAIELMKGIPTATVIASRDEAVAERLAGAFNCRSLRAYLSADVVGVEMAGALKNIFAIGAGMSDGLEFGDNTKGALVARGLLEMTRLGVMMGAQVETFFGIAGVGDLFATANSKLSRNYRLGVSLAKGQTLEQALEELGQVAEGAATAQAAAVLARRNGVPVPIMDMIDSVIRGKLLPRDGVAMLMDRMPKREGWETVDLASLN